MPAAGRVVMTVPTLSMGDGQPTEEFGHLPVVSPFRPDDHVPVVGHHGITENSQRFPRVRLVQDSLERHVVFVLLKQRHPRIGAVQHMVDKITLD